MDKSYIKDEFNSLNEEKRIIFLEYFTKSLEGVTDNWQYHGSFVEDEIEGVYYIGVEEATLIIEESGKNIKDIQLKFKSIWKKGIIDSIEITCDDSSFNLDEFISSKVTQALSFAFGQKVESFFFRTKYYYMGNKLGGDYYIQNWRIAPATPENQFFFMSESAIYFDMKVEGINERHAYSYFQRTGREVTALLSVILNLGIYENRHDFKWVQINETESKSLRMGYIDDTIYPECMPPKIKEKLGPFVEPKEVTVIKDLDKNVCPPNNIRKLFRAYENLKYVEQEAFISAARMFQLALSLGSHNKTVNISYQIAALDSLSKTIRENNKNRNAILSLVQKYSPGDEIIVGKMYDSIRSAHFHQGYFTESDINGLIIKPFMGPKSIHGEEDTFLSSKVVRKVLISWLSQRISESE